MVQPKPVAFRPRTCPGRWNRTGSGRAGFICHSLTPDRTWHKVNDSKVGLLWKLREQGVRLDPRLERCWTILVIGSLCAMWNDDPCWTWTQMWVQARMPDYSLNWTKRSSVILCLSMTSSPIRICSWPWNRCSSGELAADWFLVAVCCIYIVSSAATLLGRVKGILYTGIPFIKYNNKILHYNLKKNF